MKLRLLGEIVAKIWNIQDRYGNEIYLTDERWQHLVKNHVDMEGYLEELRETIRKGHRYQEPINPRKYRYVIFKIKVDENGNVVDNNFILTAYQKYIYHRR